MNPRTIVVGTFPIIVDYSRSLVDMYKTADFYRSRHTEESLNEKNFPLTGNGLVKSDLVLVYMDQYCIYEEAVLDLDELGLRPAKLEELFSFAESHPNALPAKYSFCSIAAFGSQFTCEAGLRNVPFILPENDDRPYSFDFEWENCEWGGGYIMAAVRK